MILLHQANRLETLADHLAGELFSREAAGDPLRKELVVVPNPGTGRWLLQRLASRQGVAANLELPLPASFFWRVLQAWMPQQEQSLFDREILVWRILSALPRLLAAPESAPLRHFLQGGEPDLRRYQLAMRIADLFDKYLVFRPDWMLAWEEGGGEGWQPRLWREITREERNHRARLLAELLHRMEETPPREGVLPPRLFLFGLNALPPVYLEILRRLGDRLEVSIHHLNPCREYWADLRSERSLAHHQNPQDAFLELGNPLLASLGHVGQVFLDQLVNLESDLREHFQPPVGAGVLHRLQADILALRDGRGQGSLLPGEAWPSIQFHGTHTRLREVQVLHDNLLRCFEELPGLQPRDILVMAPDMGAYAPFVEAVFGTREESQRIPFSISDRSPAADTPLGEALGWLLELPSSRLEASEVLALLEVAAVQRRFGLDEEGLERIRTWVRESGIRWALDGGHRRELGLPGEEGLHSWRFGLRRLFLGYVTPAQEESVLYGDGVAPYLHIHGSELAWAGALQELLDRLDHWRGRLAVSRSPARWREELARLLQDFFLPEEEEERWLLQEVRQALDGWAQGAEQGGFQEELSLAVVRQWLAEALEDSSRSRGFLEAGVTFSNLLPMRALPFRVICLLGMNDSDFPRSQPRLSFDLMAAAPRRGDRDRRRDDRYLFLETLVSARDCLLISYQSRDVRSNRPRLPAEVVSELMDYLDGRFDGEEKAASRQLQVQHPLQPFSRRYFSPEEPALFTYDRSWAVAAGGRQAPPFLEGALPPVKLEPALELDELVRFLCAPGEAFLRRRLAMRLPGEEPLVEDTEPFAVEGLEAWQLKNRLLEARLQGSDPKEVERHLRGEGLLPHGLPGAWARARLEEAVATLSRRLAPLLEAAPQQTALEIALEIDGWRLWGRVEAYTGEGLLHFRVGKLRAADRLGLWVRHLAAAARQEGAARSWLVAEDATLVLGPVAAREAERCLARLLELYREGMQAPLRFFPRTSWEYITGNGRWRQTWEGSRYSRGEGDEPANRLLFGHDDPLDEHFEALSRRVWQPLLEHLEEEPA